MRAHDEDDEGDDALAERGSNGDPGAVKVLQDRYQGKVVYFASLVHGASAEVEKSALEKLEKSLRFEKLKAFKEIKALKSDTFFSAWLYREILSGIDSP